MVGFSTFTELKTPRLVAFSALSADGQIQQYFSRNFNCNISLIKCLFQYADFGAGDKVAAFGIASLVATTAGGKSTITKTTAAAGATALVLLKKFLFIPILLAFVAITKFFRGLFSSRK